MAIVVHKYGGTSVGSVDRIRAIADRVIRAHRAGDQLLVVVSAMGETTDHLMELARQITVRPNQRELDMLLTAGERISMALLALALQEHGARAVSFTGSQSGIITDEWHGRARITEIRPVRLRQNLEEGAIVIVAGFQGVSREKNVTTLGRGGSDTSAVALAAVFEAPCVIHTDVSGVYTADPRAVPGARLISRIDYPTLSRMAHLGSQVLHPRSLDLAAKFKIPLTVKSSFDDEEGTVVVHDDSLEGPAVRAVAAVKRVQLVEITGGQATESAVPDLLGVLSRLHASMELVSIESSAEGTRLSWPLPVAEAERFRTGWEAGERPAGQWQLRLGPECSLVSMVGQELAGDADVALTAAQKLAGSGIPVHALRSSSAAQSFLVDSKRADEAARLLHEVFVEKRG
jgi:aspartate kinase